MQRSIRGERPAVADSAFVSEMSYLVGDVSINEKASIWPFVCLRGDGGTVDIGERTNIQEFSMIHGATIDDRVTVGHSVVIDYATIESDSLVGIGSAVLEGAYVESNCIVAAGSVVTHDQTVPKGHLAYGIPAETRELTDDQCNEIQRIQEHYVDLSEEYRKTGSLV